MNKISIKILILALCSLVVLSAFEDVYSRKVSLYKISDNAEDTYYLTANPAALQYEKNIELFSVGLNYEDRMYKRTFDPSVTQDIKASFYTLRKIGDNSFFAAGISYDDLRLKDMYGSREKDFYDDYFSMIDSAGGSTSYYGPQLNFLYNVELADDLYFGIQGDYGVERGLKDTFPQTITIMRNSSYRLGLDYRKDKFALGLFARYYDDQSHYESVKRYQQVIPKTYMGYHVFYNELSSSTSKKKRVRNGLETGANIRIGSAEKRVLNLSASWLYRSSEAEIYTSYSKPRGYWQRNGLHVMADASSYTIPDVGIRVYGEYLAFADWGKSLISNALVLENEESYINGGLVLSYTPSHLEKSWVGAEAGYVDFKYVEYLFPFEDERSGIEWNIHAGTELMLSEKLKAGFAFNYEKTVPKFYWNCDYFQNTGLRIMLEHLFSFGYIGLNLENIKQKPSNDENLNTLYQLTLTYRRK